MLAIWDRLPIKAEGLTPADCPASLAFTKACTRAVAAAKFKLLALTALLTALAVELTHALQAVGVAQLLMQLLDVIAFRATVGLLEFKRRDVNDLIVFNAEADEMLLDSPCKI